MLNRRNTTPGYNVDTRSHGVR